MYTKMVYETNTNNNRVSPVIISLLYFDRVSTVTSSETMRAREKENRRDGRERLGENVRRV